MSMTLLGIGTATPPAVPQSDAAALATARCCTTSAQDRLLHTLYRQSTVTSRASVLLSDAPHASTRHPAHTKRQADNPRPTANGIEHFYPPPTDAHPHGPTVAQRMQRYARDAPPLAASAARTALEQAGMTADDVRQLVVVSCTGFSAPGVDLQLVERLHLPPTVGRTVIGFMGCHGAINGLRIGDALATSQPGQPVLVCAVELCSLHFQYRWKPQQMVANALFADGAAAVVGITSSGSTHHRPGPRLIATGSCTVPRSRDDMTWTIDDHGFIMTLSPRVPSLIQTHLRPWFTHWLAAQGLTIGDIGSWAIHPGGPRIIDAVESALDLPPDAAAESRAMLAQRGNMSSPTVLFILDHLMRTKAPTPTVLLAFGPGLVVEVALIA